MPYARRPFNPLIPTPNQVVNELNQANENFDLLSRVFLNNDPATRVLKSDVYTFRRVNLTSATSDYELQVGEEAFIDFVSILEVPLRIATDFNRLYEMFICIRGASGGIARLAPNNTFYNASFSFVLVRWQSNTSSTFHFSNDSVDAFRFDTAAIADIYLIIDTYTGQIQGFCGARVLSIATFSNFASVWRSNFTSWTSLGTLHFTSPTTGYVLIRRLL